MSQPTPAEALSLQAASVIDEAAAELMRREPGLSLSDAARRVMRENPHLAAAYSGDIAAFTELSQRARTAELRQRQAAHLATAMARPIRSRAELRAGEVACLRMGAGPGSGLFAEPAP